MLRLTIFLLALVVSCQQKETVKKDAGRTDSIFVDTTQNKPVADVAVNVSKPLPKIEILFTGIFHGDEVKTNIEDLPWLELFADDDGNFVLTKTKIIAERVVDGLMDDEESGEKTGWQIGTPSARHPTILVTGGDFTEGKIDASPIPVALYPGDSVQLHFKGVHYLLYATGLRRMDSVAGVIHVSEYNLFLIRTHNGTSHRTSLVNHESFDDAMTSILWSGDLDKDGYMDFIIDMSRHYNKKLPTLFLSKPAKDDQMVVAVAEHASVGC